jgi:uncharacterized protein
MIDYLAIIKKYCGENEELKTILISHSRQVANRALAILSKHPDWVENGLVDPVFIEEAAMLHDLGIFLTDAPRIYCFGTEPYLCHGYLGGKLLRASGFERHARVCERHTGTGLTKEAIEANGWNLPVMDFIPETIEEQLICFADKFYSKTKFLETARTLEQVVESMAKISPEAVEKVKEWAVMFM